MDFGTVLETVSRFLEEKDSPYAVIGGIAIASYGLLRTTRDLDFVVDGSIQDPLIEFMESRGYRTLYRSSGYSNHSHAETRWGDVDFVYIRGETSQKVFAARRWEPGPGDRQIPVPKPEHLIAMKLQALKNDPERELQDMADIRYLLTLRGVDRQEIRDYFDRQGMTNRFDEINKT